jgi:hypothetical protein
MNDSVHEDLGYQSEAEPMDRSRFVVKKRIRYTQGQMKDRVVDLKDTIADDLIAHGMAVEVGRQPGEDD